MSSFSDKQWSTEEGYVAGIATDIEYKSSYDSWVVTITDDGKTPTGNTFKIYSAYKESSSVKDPAIGDYVVGRGYFTKYYSGLYEIAWSSSPAHEAFIVSCTSQTYTTLYKIVNKAGNEISSLATITNLPATVSNGQSVSFTVTPSSTYSVYRVTLNGSTLNSSGNSYTFTRNADQPLRRSSQEHYGRNSQEVIPLANYLLEI